MPFHPLQTSDGWFWPKKMTKTPTATAQNIREYLRTIRKLISPFTPSIFSNGQDDTEETNSWSWVRPLKSSIDTKKMMSNDALEDVSPFKKLLFLVSMLNFGGVSATQNSASKEQHSRRESPAGLPKTFLDRPPGTALPGTTKRGFQYLQKCSLLSDVKKMSNAAFFL